MSLCPPDQPPRDLRTMLAASLALATNAVRLERFSIEFCHVPGRRTAWVTANAPLAFVIRGLVERTACNPGQLTVGLIAIGPDGGARPDATGLYALQESGHLRLLGVITSPIDRRQFDAAIEACARAAWAGQS